MTHVDLKASTGSINSTPHVFRCPLAYFPQCQKSPESVHEPTSGNDITSAVEYVWLTNWRRRLTWTGYSTLERKTPVWRVSSGRMERALALSHAVEVCMQKTVGTSLWISREMEDVMTIVVSVVMSVVVWDTKWKIR